MSSELTRRVVVSVIAAPVAVAIVLAGGWLLAALLAMTSAVAAWEIFRLARGSGLQPMDDLGIVIAGVTPLVVHARYLGLYNAERAPGALSIVACVLLVVLAASIWARGPAGKPIGAAAVTIFGAAYTGGMLSYAYAIRYHEYAFAPAPLTLGGHAFNVPSGGLLLLLPLFGTWASDIGAYAVGRVLGRQKLIPSVSPGKTVEGALGGLAATMLLSWAYVRWILHPAAHLDFRTSPVGVLAFGVLVSVAAQVGDLAESLIKRDAGMKDSSHLIPGHGGVLDRIDSLLFVLPVSYVLLSLLLTWAP